MYAWFDTLGFDEVRTAPIVKVVLADKPSVQRAVGFISDVHGGSFDVLTLGLDRVHFDGDKAPTVKPVTITDQQFGEFSGSYVHGPQSQWPREPFVLARAADARHLPALSQQLFQAAKVASSKPNRNDAATAEIRDAIAESAYSSIGKDLTNPECPRTTLLAKLKSFQLHFPGSSHDAAAAELASTLEQMIKEDAGHQTLPAATEPQRIAELMFRLRDQTDPPAMIGHISMSEAASEALASDPMSPAGRLKEIGYPAVPALIDALSSRELTRMHGRVDVLRVGEASLQLLQDISCKEWIPEDEDQIATISSADPELDAEIRDWWKSAKETGEKRTLIHQLEAGGLTSLLSAKRLVKADPSGAIEPILNAIGQVKDDEVRVVLVAALSEVHSGQAVEAMRSEVGKLPDTDSRFLAAKYLAHTAPDEAFSIALDIYREVQGKPQPPFSKLEDSVEAFLTESGRAEGIAAIGQDLATAEPSMRFRVIFHLSKDPYQASGRPSGLPVPKSPQERQRYELAVESLLAGELNDTHRYAGSVEPSLAISAPGAKGRVTYWRLCDYAAEVLSHRFPDRYRFAQGLSSTKMEVQRIDDINVWRKKTGEKPMEVPLSFQ